MNRNLIIVLLITSILIISGCSFINTEEPQESPKQITNEVANGITLSADKKTIHVENVNDVEIVNSNTLYFRTLGLAMPCVCLSGSGTGYCQSSGPDPASNYHCWGSMCGNDTGFGGGCVFTGMMPYTSFPIS